VDKAYGFGLRIPQLFTGGNLLYNPNTQLIPQHGGITMESIQGINLTQFPLKNLSKVAELIYFDGPLLSLFESPNKDNYLYYWCDVDNNYNRWLVFRINTRDLNLYLTGQVRLQKLLLYPIDGFLYAVDIDNDIQYCNIYLLYPENLPEIYLPDEDSFYEFEPLFLDTQNGVEKQKSQPILVDKKWILEDILQLAYH